MRSLSNELDSARAELEKARKSPSIDPTLEARVAELRGDNEALQKRLQALSDELNAARAESERLRGAPAAPTAEEVAALRARAVEVFEAINDFMSELRGNILVARDEFDALRGAGQIQPDERTTTILEAVRSAVGQTEDIKGALRGLRALGEG